MPKFTGVFSISYPQVNRKETKSGGAVTYPFASNISNASREDCSLTSVLLDSCWRPASLSLVRLLKWGVEWKIFNGVTTDSSSNQVLMCAERKRSEIVTDIRSMPNSKQISLHAALSSMVLWWSKRNSRIHIAEKKGMHGTTYLRSRADGGERDASTKPNLSTTAGSIGGSGGTCPESTLRLHMSCRNSSNLVVNQKGTPNR